ADPRAQMSSEDDPARLGRCEIDVTGRPAKAELRATQPDTDGAIGSAGGAVRIRPGNERARHHQPLLREVEMKDADARRRVIRLDDAVAARELGPDRRLLVVGISAR